jgi:hypothetical protein
MMILEGLALKALILYNRWAQQASYAPLSVVLPNPLVLNLGGDALIQVDAAQRDFLLLEAKPEEVGHLDPKVVPIRKAT